EEEGGTNITVLRSSIILILSLTYFILITILTAYIGVIPTADSTGTIALLLVVIPAYGVLHYRYWSVPLYSVRSTMRELVKRLMHYGTFVLMLQLFALNMRAI